MTLADVEYDATSEIGKKVLPERPVEVPPPLKPSTIQVLEIIIDHQFKTRYYLVHVLTRRSASVVEHQRSMLQSDRQTDQYLSIGVQAMNGSVLLVMGSWISVSYTSTIYRRS